MLDPSADITLLSGDVESALACIPSECVDAVITDPPYNINIKGSGSWDHYNADAFIDWCESWARECLRILKPGGLIFSFGSPKTWHQMALGVERAGFIMLDSIDWVYVAAMQRSFDLAPQLIGVEDPVRRAELADRSYSLANRHDPIFVGRKRSRGSLLATAVQYGTATMDVVSTRAADGSWPGNVVFSHHPDCVEGSACVLPCPVAEMGPCAVSFPCFYWCPKAGAAEKVSVEVEVGEGTQKLFHIDRKRWRCRNPDCQRVTGSYLGSANQSIPHDICGHHDWEPLHRNVYSHTITHPDPKPVSLGRWLMRLGTLPGALVVDCFAGSGALVEAAVIERRRIIAIDNYDPYLELVRARLRRQFCSRLSDAKVIGGSDVALR